MPWKTDDYIDLLTPFQSGYSMGQINRSRKLQEEQARVREAQVAQQMGVEPVRGADGRIDWAMTEQLARVQREQDATAAEIGMRHGLGIAGPPTEGEAALMNTPAYKQTRMKAELAKYERDAQTEAWLRRIEEEGRWRERVAEQNAAAREEMRAAAAAESKDRANRITRTRIDPETGERITETFPASMAPKLGAESKPADERVRKIQKAIEDVKIAEAMGQAIDLEQDAAGLPYVERSRGWFGHTASKSDPMKYKVQIEKLMQQLSEVEGALGMVPESGIAAPGLTHDASGRRIR